MSSELKLSGSKAGRVILQGNDTITTDQTFTFPDTGGELATKAAGQPPAVGYQQGTLPANIGFNGSGTTSKDFQNGQDNSFVTSTRRSARYTRMGPLVTVHIDWAGRINWTTVDGWAFKDRTLCFGLPYRSGNPVGSNDNSFIIPTSTFRNWTTKLPFGSATYCEGPLSAIGPGEDYIKFIEVKNNGSPDTSLTWAAWRVGQTGEQVFEVQIFMSYWTDDTTWDPDNGAVAS